ncbi:periplasmic binding protein-like I [Globomyces pollinis-pini]|nr:periplasmic binding protein-like I [Globomyces pollinis-pini]
MNLLLLFISLTICHCLSPNGAKKLKIGISLGFTSEGGNTIDGTQAIYLRIKQLNEESSLIGNDVALEPLFLNHEIARDKTIINALEFQRQGVVAVIGSGYSTLTILTSLVLQNYNIPQCCGASTNPSLSDKKQYPNFFRVIPTDASQAKAIIGCVIASGWKKIAIVYTNEDYGSGLANYLTNYARQNSIEILAKVNIELGITAVGATPALQTVQESEARIIIYCGYFLEYLTVVEVAKTLGIYGKDYVWLASEDVYSLHPDDAKAVSGTLVFYPREAAGPASKSFANYWLEHRLQSQFINKTYSAIDASQPYVYYFASCVDLLVHGFDVLLKSNNSYTIDDLVAGRLNNLMSRGDFFNFPEVTTPSGNVKLEENGDRKGDFNMYNFVVDGSKVLVGGWIDEKKVLVAGESILYPGGSFIQPKDGIDPEDVAEYANPSSMLAIISYLFTIIVIATTFLSLVGMIKYRDKKIVRVSGLTISLIMHVCIIFGSMQFLIMVDKPLEWKCKLDSFVIPISFSLYYGLLFAKNYQIYRIFYHPTTSKHITKTTMVLLIAVLFTIPSLVISTVWITIDAPLPTIAKLSQSQFYRTCKSDIGFGAKSINALLVVNSLVLLANLLMAVLTRNVVSTHNETKMIGLSVYNTSVISLFTIVTVNSGSLSFSAKYLIKAIAIFYVLMFNLASRFLYKLRQIILNSENNATQTSSYASKGDGKVSKKEGEEEESLVTVKKYGTFTTETNDAHMRVISSECVVLFKRKKVSLESKDIKDDGTGTAWFVSKLKHFSMTTRGNLTCRFQVDDIVYDISFSDEDSITFWTKYFASWSYRVLNCGTQSDYIKSSLA